MQSPMMVKRRTQSTDFSALNIAFNKINQLTLLQKGAKAPKEYSPPFSGL